MRINTNTSSLFAQRSLSRLNTALAKSLHRLASGQRINSAKDDAAGLAIATGIQSQRRGMLQAIRNINNARDFLNTADGALASQSDLIQRMRELALQSANGTLSDNDRSHLTTEFTQLLAEFNRISSQAEFNGTKLLDGSFTTTTVQVGSRKGESISFNLRSMQPTTVFQAVDSDGAAVGDGTFAARQTISSGGMPYWISLPDVNSDGNLDTVTADRSSETISIRLGAGDGTFGTRVTIATGGSTPEYVDAADINNDGKIDLVVEADNVTLFLGNGNGTFQASAVLPSSANPLGPTFKDINADGNMDLLISEYTDGVLSIHMGLGNGTFTARTTVTIRSGARFISSGDFDGDNKMDFVVSALDGVLTVLLGNGNGTFQTRRTLDAGAEARVVLPGDLNNDSRTDLVSLDSGILSVFMGNGNGTFAARTIVATGVGAFDGVAMDINNDNKLDVITADYSSGYLSIHLGNGDGTFIARRTIVSDSMTKTIAAGDLNNDGVSDLATSDDISNNISIYLANTTTAPLTITNMEIGTYEDATQALLLTDAAMSYLISARAEIGAFQNRFDFTSSVAQATTESMAAQLSQILDTDIAYEVAELSRIQIMQQAAVAVLGQANMNLQLVLNLLKVT